MAFDTSNTGPTPLRVKMNPLFRPDAELRELSARLITAASMGDMITCASITERYGVGLLNKGDYDGRTPIHLATRLTRSVPCGGGAAFAEMDVLHSNIKPSIVVK